MTPLSTQERFKRGAADAGPFFKYMAEFVGFTDADAAHQVEAAAGDARHAPAPLATTPVAPMATPVRPAGSPAGM